MVVSTVALAAAALLIEAVLGYPAPIYGVIGHPVTWMGRWLSLLDRVLNKPEWSPGRRRVAGVVALGALLLPTAGFGAAITMLPLAFGIVLLAAVVASSLLAQRSLHTHIAAVALALETEGLEGGRRAVSMVVGRNPAHLDQAGVARAAIESLAENFSDGVVAPAFWLALAGLPGGACYKAINTADSMIGHRTERHEAFGWAAARLDDLVNLPASRLSALLIILAALVCGADARGGARTVHRDARRHRSPNAGWPEAAMAGALGLQLAGPRVYGDQLVVDAYMGNGRRGATASDIHQALRLYRTACAIQFLAMTMIAGGLLIL